VELPKGVALVRIREHGQRVILVSDDLNRDQEVCARVLAAIIADTTPFVLLTKTDVSAAMAAAS
jgi:hypothetical protein